MMNTVDVTGKRQKVNVMGSPLREAMGRSGAVLYFMGHLREPGGMSVVLWGCSNAGPGQVRRVQRRDLQDGSCALWPPLPHLPTHWVQRAMDFI